MAVDHETVNAIVAEFDARLESQDLKRTAAFERVYKKIDDHAERADASLQAFAKETTTAFKEVAVQVAKIETTLASHIATTTAQFNGIDAAKKESASRADGWWKTGATIVLGGGGFATFLEWLRSWKGEG